MTCRRGLVVGCGLQVVSLKKFCRSMKEKYNRANSSKMPPDVPYLAGAKRVFPSWSASPRLAQAKEGPSEDAPEDRSRLPVCRFAVAFDACVSAFTRHGVQVSMPRTRRRKTRPWAQHPVKPWRCLAGPAQADAIWAFSRLRPSNSGRVPCWQRWRGCPISPTAVGRLKKSNMAWPRHAGPWQDSEGYTGIRRYPSRLQR